MNIEQLKNRKTLDKPSVFFIEPEKKFNLNLIPEDKSIESFQTDYGRFYRVPEGVYPSATTILSAVENPAIEAWKKRLGPEGVKQVLHRASIRGTAIHKAAENYLLGITTQTVYPSTYDTFNKIKKILNEHVDNIQMIENAVYSQRLRIAGRIDLYAEYDGVPSIIDFKTSKKDKKEEWISSYFAQGFIYSHAIEELTGTRPESIVIIMASDTNDDALIFKKSSRDSNAEKYVRDARASFIKTLRQREKESR